MITMTVDTLKKLKMILYKVNNWLILQIYNTKKGITITNAFQKILNNSNRKANKTC